MRSSKYHDYSVLKVALFIILVILGLLIYMNFIMPSLQHTAGEDAWVVTKVATCTEDGVRCKVCTQCGQEFDYENIPATGHSKYISKENVKAATCTEGGSYVNVERCEYCNEAFSSETVKLDNAKGHSYGPERDENIVSYHATEGTCDKVKNCTACGVEAREKNKTYAPIGHNYTDWSIEYDEENKEFVVIGCCVGCEEDDNTITLTTDDQNQNFQLTSTYDSSYAPCCKNQYNVEFKFIYQYNGITYTKTMSKVIEFETESHKILATNVEDINGNLTVGYIAIEQFVKYDDCGAYYDIDNSIIAEYIYYDINREWSDDGFNVGYFLCAECCDLSCQECSVGSSLTWYAVRLYCADYDQRIVSE